MKLLWLLLALVAVATPLAMADVRADVTQDDWREKAIEYLTKAIARLEDALAKLPEDSKLRPALTKALEYLRKKLTDLQDASVSFSEVNRAGLLQKILERLEQAIEKVPEGPLRDRLQKAIDRIRELLNNVRPSDAIVVTDQIRELLEKIRRLVEAHKQAGKEALLKFLNSELLEKLISQVPEPIQTEVRSRIAKLKERLEAGALSLADWREKAIEYLTKAIARLEDALAKLPEDSKLRPALTKALEFLRKKLTDLQDASVSFSEFDRSALLRQILERLEQAIEKLPEGPQRDLMQRTIDRIRELLNRS